MAACRDHAQPAIVLLRILAGTVFLLEGNEKFTPETLVASRRAEAASARASLQLLS